MGNSKLPGYPIAAENGYYNGHADFDGFKKLELVSLMIAQGMVIASDQHGQAYYSPEVLAIDSVRYAKAVLEEANK